MVFKRFRYKPNYTNPEMSPRALEAKKRVQTKIDAGFYKYEECSCFCGRNKSVPLFEMDYFGNFYPFVICSNCGIMRANPRLTKDSYIDFYTYEYRTLYGDNDKERDWLWQHRLKQAKEVYDFINTHLRLPEEAVVFDIGCEMGAVLLPFHRDGCDVMGVDYGAEYVEFGRKKSGLRLEIGGVEKFKDTGKKADLVILNQVFEHFLDLEAELKNIRKVIKPDGFIFISVPGTLWWIKNMCGGDIMGLAQNAHTWQFNSDSLRYVMQCCGFEFAFGNSEIKSLFKISGKQRDKKDVPQGEFEKILSFLSKAERRYLPRLYAKRFVKKVRGLCRISF